MSNSALNTEHSTLALVVALLAVIVSGCVHLRLPAPAVSQPRLVALDAAACRTTLADDASAQSLQQALARSADYLRALPPERSFTVLDQRLAAAELLAMLDDLSGAGDVAEQACSRYRLYRVDLPQPLLVTGYYQPELAARRARSTRFRYPVYRTPDDLVDVELGEFCPACGGRVAHGRVRDGKLVPYYSRAEIDAGALAGRGYEIAWLDDPVEAFFLHVQGSGLLRFEDGVHMQISYSSSNGRPYTSLGGVLVKQGNIGRDAATLQGLKDYLRAHPDEQAALMATNERYIFFRTVIAGPIGSLGVPLTPGRSVAADAAVYAPGGLAFLRVQSRAAGSATDNRPAFQRFTLVQDAGAAITGAQRLDLFLGTGATAEAIAGELRNPGELYLVLPR